MVVREERSKVVYGRNWGDLFDDPIVALCVDIKGLDGWFCRWIIGDFASLSLWLVLGVCASASCLALFHSQTSQFCSVTTSCSLWILVWSQNDSGGWTLVHYPLFVLWQFSFEVDNWDLNKHLWSCTASHRRYGEESRKHENSGKCLNERMTIGIFSSWDLITL